MEQGGPNEMTKPRADGPPAAGGLLAVADAGAHAAFLATDFTPASTAASTSHTTLLRIGHARTLFSLGNQDCMATGDAGKPRRIEDRPEFKKVGTMDDQETTRQLLMEFRDAAREIAQEIRGIRSFF